MTLNEIGVAAKSLPLSREAWTKGKKMRRLQRPQTLFLNTRDILTAANEIDVKNARDKGMEGIAC